MMEYWIWLTARRGLGPVRLRRLLGEFGNPKRIYEATQEDLSRAGVSPSALKTLAQKDLEPARRVLASCRERNVRILTWADPDYPSPMRLTTNAPMVIYCMGQLPQSGKQPWVGVVGAREADAHGKRIARRIGWQIAGSGGVVVTGMARGIDAQAARGALEQGGCVVGVLGTGVDLVYPKENQAIFARVLRQGCLISEYPPGTSANAKHFPARNRIISALSDGVVVVQASEESGALITAQWAAEHGRDVFAVPGLAGEALSRGNNQLLREGAILTESGWDVMREYCCRYPGAVREYRELPPEAEPVSAQANAAKTEAEPAAAAKPVKRGAAKIEAEPTAAKPVKRSAAQPEAAQAASLLDPDTLSEAQRILVESLRGGTIQVDKLIRQVGLPTSQVLAELTILQIKKIVTQKPGKHYELALRLKTAEE